MIFKIYNDFGKSRITTRINRTGDETNPDDTFSSAFYAKRQKKMIDPAKLTLNFWDFTLPTPVRRQFFGQI